MRLFRFGANPIINADGKLVNLALWFENRNDMTGENISGNFVCTDEEFKDINSERKSVEDVITLKITNILGLNIEADTKLAITSLRKENEDLKRSLQEAIMTMTMMMGSMGGASAPIGPGDPLEPGTSDVGEDL